jgi:SAM-dependent methyltransferase
VSTQAVNPNKALWEKGDFTCIAETMRESGDALVRQLGVTAGMKVLDLGCGDGTTAIPEAERGADVLGVDITAKLLAAGRARAEAAGLTNIRFQEGDASHLDDLEDDTFDLVVSIFGAMFAPNPFDVAKEMVRVTKPGGRVVMGNWIPGDPTLVAQLLKVSGAYSPPPPEGFVSPVTWGVENDVLERFSRAGVAADQVTCTRESFTFTHSGTPSDLLALFRDYYGPTMNAYAAAEADGRADELHAELEALFDSENDATDGSTSISATYLLVEAEVG